MQLLIQTTSMMPPSPTQVLNYSHETGKPMQNVAEHGNKL